MRHLPPLAALAGAVLLAVFALSFALSSPPDAEVQRDAAIERTAKAGPALTPQDAMPATPTVESEPRFAAEAETAFVAEPFERVREDELPEGIATAFDRTIFRQRFARIDPTQFEVDARLSWNLFDDVAHDLVLEEAEWQSVDGSKLLWRGRVAGDPASEVVMRVDNGAVTGNVSTSDGRVFAIDTFGDTQRIQEVDVAALPACGSESAAAETGAAGDEGGAGPPAPPSAAASSGPEVIDVLMLYTPDARDYYGGTSAIENRLALLIDWSNAVYENSNATQRLRAAAIQEVAYDDSHADGGIALNDLTYTEDGELEGVHALRDQAGADMVSLITAPNNVCGIAWVASSASLINWYEDYMYSVVNVQCISSPRTFAHELAHNQGAYHDPTTSISQGMTQPEIDAVPFPNSFGYIAPGDAFRTIMAYGSSCSWCPSLEQFSNKNQTHLGQPAGTTRSNVHETLQNTYLAVAAFRDPAACTGQADSDSDGVCDSLDNCLQHDNPLQQDEDGDGFGNACDADYNNDGGVGLPDFSEMLENLGTQTGDPGYDATYDHTEDGAVGTPDFGFLLEQLGGTPGPSALLCAGSIPCGS